jgi:hypothetical protein
LNHVERGTINPQIQPALRLVDRAVVMELPPRATHHAP